MSDILPPGHPDLDDDPKGDVLPPGIVLNPTEEYYAAMRTLRLAADILIREGELPESFEGYVSSVDLATAIGEVQAWAMDSFFLKAESGDLVLGIDDIAGLQAALDGKLDDPIVVTIADITGLTDALTLKAAAAHGHAIDDVSGLQDELDALAEAIDDIDTGGTGYSPPIPQSDVTDLVADLAALTAADSALDVRVDALESGVPADISALDARLDTAEADITALEGADTALDTRIDALEGAVGVSDFLDLNDVPLNYTGDAYKSVRVNSAESALVFADDPFFISITITGKPTALENLIYIPMGFAALFRAGTTGAMGRATVAATADTTFTIKQNTTTIGTVVFNAAQTTAGINFSSDVVFTPNTLLVLEAPNPQDATLANIGITIPGFKRI